MDVTDPGNGHVKITLDDGAAEHLTPTEAIVEAIELLDKANHVLDRDYRIEAIKDKAG